MLCSLPLVTEPREARVDVTLRITAKCGEWGVGIPFPPPAEGSNPGLYREVGGMTVLAATLNKGKKIVVALMSAMTLMKKMDWR
jgi:hypothetical protein